jgi:polyhydroxyalkanoate synthase
MENRALKEIDAIEAEEASPAANAILGANPFVELGTQDIFATYGELLRSIVARPERLWPAAGKLAAELYKIALGDSDIQPAAGDRRFVDPAWQENAFYRRLMQGYLAWRQAGLSLVESPNDGGSDWKVPAQHRFAMMLLTEALAPTNTLWGNPAALKRVFDTAGVSLIDGMRNFVDDLINNGGMPSQVDKRPFKVGQTIATTPGAVIFRGELCEVIQYAPATRQVRTRPLLLVPPQINKYYVMDLAPKRSLIEYAVAQGIQVFTISWRNPGPEYRDRGLNDYVAAIKEVIGVVTAVTGSADVNLLAVCSGGMTATLLLGHLAASGDKRVNAATLLVTMLTSGDASMTGMFATEETVRAACLRSYERGVLDAGTMSRLFAWLRPNDLVWHYWVNNYLMGKDPAPFDLLYWNADSTNLPAALHAGFLDLLLRNSLVEPGRIEILGTPINLRAVTHDMYVVGGQTDHICSWRACYRATGLFGGSTEFVLNGSGHVQTLVCPPGNFKAKYFTNHRRGPDPDQWLQGATEQKGSWWDNWIEWLQRRSGEWRPAPETLGSADYRPIEPAPGVFVHQLP